MERIDTAFCGHCHEEKLVEEFCWLNKAKGTYQSWCKDCTAANTKRWSLAYPEKKKACSKRWYQANIEKSAVASKKWQQTNPEKMAVIIKRWRLNGGREWEKKWKKANSEKLAVYSKKWSQANPEKRAAISKKWKRANPEKIAVIMKRWHQANPAKRAINAARRRAAELRRTPLWSDLKAIEQFYIDCPQGMVVDHDIPLQGKLVSGLHVLSNLRYLTKSENSKKHNKFDPIAYNNLKKKV